MTCALCPATRLVARGLCHRCYQRYLHRKNHNPDTWTGWPTPQLEREKAKGFQCDIHESRPVYAKGMCRPCYRKTRRRVLAQPDFWATVQGRTV